VRVALGNFLEMYDFMVFGYYAAPSGAPFSGPERVRSLMLALMTFGTGYLMRPLGPFCWRLIDRHGHTPIESLLDFLMQWKRDAFAAGRCASVAVNVGASKTGPRGRINSPYQKSIKASISEAYRSGPEKGAPDAAA